MCGIAGIFSPQGISPDDLIKMSRKIAHRGPDGEGFVYFSQNIAVPIASSQTTENCIGQSLPWSPSNRENHLPENVVGGFAHRRLSIIDLAATGHQPMCSADLRYWITYNGELYNYIEIREQLQNQGIVFITQSDTEVILQAYLHWGEECLQRFNGMWAFCIYDTQRQQLFASRDRFGVKPFYYSTFVGKFAFASEQKALLCLPWMPVKVNPDAVFDYFVFSQIEYHPQGFFDEIIELPAGHSLNYSLQNKHVKTKAWYHLPVNHEKAVWEKSTHDLHVSRIQDLLSDAIRLRLRADVPVGSCLSGGLDSSAIVGWMRKHLGNDLPLHVYTAIFPESKVDESHWAKIMAQSTHAIHHEVSPQPEMLISELETLSKCQDIPIWSTSTYAQFKVMQSVKESGIKVVLDGQGGDEIFGGYEPHRSFYWKGLPMNAMIREMKQGEGLKKNLRFHFHQQARYDYVFQIPSTLGSSFYKNWFSENQYLNDSFFNQEISRFDLQKNRNTKDLNSRLAHEMQNTSLKGYLKCEDRCAMWHGVESRTPFADDIPLIEYLFSVPAVYKMHGARLKALLRDSSSAVIPISIQNRVDKQGYTTPNNEWIRRIAPHFREQFNEVLAPFLNVKKIHSAYSNLFNPTGEADTGRIFKFISFAVWMQMLGKIKEE